MSKPYPIQIQYVQEATGLPEEMLEACPFTRNREPTYGLWNVVWNLGYKNEPSKLAKMNAITKVMAVGIEYLKKDRQRYPNSFVDEIWGNVTKECIDVCRQHWNSFVNREWNGNHLSDIIDELPNSAEDFPDYITSIEEGNVEGANISKDIADEQLEDVKKKLEDLKGKMKETEDDVEWAEEGQAVADDGVDEAKKKLEEEIKKLKEIERPVNEDELISQIPDGFNLGSINDFVAWVYETFSPKVEKTTKTGSKFSVEKRGSGITITPESTNTERRMPESELKRYYRITKNLESSGKTPDWNTILSLGPYEPPDGGQNASYYVVILKEYVLEKLYTAKGIPLDYQPGQESSERTQDEQPKVRKIGDKLEINGKIVTSKTLVPIAIRFLKDAEWHTKEEFDEWLLKHFDITEEDSRNAMYDHSRASVHSGTVLYIKAAGAISMIRKAEWLEEKDKGSPPWRLNGFAQRNIVPLNDATIIAKLAELHISDDPDDVSLDMETDVKEIKNGPVPRLTPEEISEGVNAIKRQLLIDESTIREIVVNLMANRHILLTGPVGCGKTELARIIPEVFWAKHDGGYFADVHTATADWTTNDVIGGITPFMENNEIGYKFENGCVTHAISENWNEHSKRTSSIQEPWCAKKYPDGSDPLKNRSFRGVWLVIDEFNRADIDKAFGQLFTAVESGIVKTSNVDKEKDVIKFKFPNDFRIIGTLNTSDKHHLFHLSDALKRRFAIIKIDNPLTNDPGEELQFAARAAIRAIAGGGAPLGQTEWKPSDEDEVETITRIFRFVRREKPLGLGVLKSILQTFMVSKQTIDVKVNEEYEAVDIALTNNLSPQLESLEKEPLDVLYEIVSDGNPIARFKEYEADEIKRPEYKKSFGLFLELLGYPKSGELGWVKRVDQFAGKDSVFDIELPIADNKQNTFLSVLLADYEKSFWQNNTLKKFAASLDEIRKTLI